MPDGLSAEGGGPVDGVDLIPSPLSHNAPFHCAVQGILGGSHQILLTKFDAEAMLRIIQDYRCTFSYLVPTIMKRVWDLPAATRNAYDVSSLQGVFHMAAPCPPWLKEAWCHWLGPHKVYELYGATEAMGYTIIRGDEWLRVPKIEGLNLVGRPAAGHIKIIDSETKRQLPPGEMGEVWMRHHERRVTYTYRGAVSKPDEDGWETCGDLGLLDAQGYCHLGDRKSDMVLVGGVNVYPAEVEVRVLSHLLHPHPTLQLPAGSFSLLLLASPCFSLLLASPCSKPRRFTPFHAVSASCSARVHSHAWRCASLLRPCSSRTRPCGVLSWWGCRALTSGGRCTRSCTRSATRSPVMSCARSASTTFRSPRCPRASASSTSICAGRTARYAART